MRFVIALSVFTLFAQVAVAADITHAQNLFEAGRFKDSVVAFEKVLPQLSGKEKIDARFRYGMALLRARQDDKAIAEFTTYVSEDNQSPVYAQVALRHIGYLHALNRRYDEAVAAYDKAFAMEGGQPTMYAEIMVMRGHSFNKLKRYDDAIASYLIGAVVPESNFVTRQTAYVSAGNLYQNLERYQEAMEQFQNAIDLGAKSHYGHRANNHLIECRAALSGSDTFFLEPYITNLDETTAHVTWVSRNDAPLGRVEVDGRTFQSVRTDFKGVHAFRQLAVVTGLEPGKRYRYVAHCGEEQFDGTFMTAPTDGRPIRFSVIGDTQGGHVVHDEVARDIAEDKPEFVVHVGDCVERGNRWDEWKVQLFDPGRPYLNDAPIWPARGNHDGGPYFKILFGRDERDYEDYRFGDVHVFCMDSQYSVGGSARAAQLEWLREGLTNSTAKWKLVALHHPMVIVPPPWKPFGQEDFLQVVQECGADVVLTGHYHVYSRLRPLLKKGQTKPVLHLITGGGGGNMGSYTPSPIVTTYNTDHHHLSFVADGDTLSMQMKLRGNKVFDEYTLKHDNGSYQKQVMDETVDLDLGIDMTYLYHTITDPNYRVDDLLLTAGTTPEAGKPVKVTLQHSMVHQDKLPKGAELVIRSAPGDAWQVDEQVVRIGAGEWEFEVTAPAEMPPVGNRFGPAMNVQVQLRIDGVDYAPDQFKAIVEQ